MSDLQVLNRTGQSGGWIPKLRMGRLCVNIMNQGAATLNFAAAKKKGLKKDTTNPNRSIIHCP
jgi:hypothetical protein